MRARGRSAAQYGRTCGAALTGLALIGLLMLLAGCTPGGDRGPASRDVMPQPGALPEMKRFSATRPKPPQRANRDMMRDFLDLSFAMESGRTLPHFSRFEGPVTVRLTGAPPATLVTDLDRLIGRLRTEAGLDIRRVSGGAANITDTSCFSMS